MEEGTDNNPGMETLGRDARAGIARQLTGDLWCIGCGYNLRGLSIREMCPECGVPVRATILGVIDPKAHELTPLKRPKLVGVGLVAWAVGLWLATAAVGVMRGAEILREMAQVRWWTGWAPVLGMAGLVISGLGAMTLIRPHRRVGRLEAVRAALGVAAYFPLVSIYYSIYARLDLTSPTPFLEPGPLEVERSALRLGLFVFVILLIWGLRDQVRGLALRSVVVRTGRVDRQSMMAVLASFGVAAAGDVLHVLSGVIGGSAAGLVATVGTVLLAVGSVLVLVGVSNIVLDAVRLWPIIVRSGVGLTDVLEDNAARARRTGQA